MADPLSAIGLAASLVQLLSFSEGLISKSIEIYHTVDGSQIELTELDAILDSFAGLLDNLTQNHEGYNPSISQNGFAKTSKRLRIGTQLDALVESTRQVIEEMVELIKKLRGGELRNKAWASLRQAFLTIINERKLQDLEHRLDRLRKQIDTSLLSSLWTSFPESEMQKARVLQNIEERLKALSERSDQYTAVLEKWYEHMQVEQPANDTCEQVPELAAMILREDRPQRESALKRGLVDSLRFESMPARYEAIPEAYRETFQWAFLTGYHPEDGVIDLTESLDLRQSFGSWLESPSKLYWITGKPGSGKSTLMKFLASHPRTLLTAQRWQPVARQAVKSNGPPLSSPSRDGKSRSRQPLHMAASYFWNPGLALQKSRLGLYRTLLHQLFEHDKNIAERIDEVLPDRWQRIIKFGNDRRQFTEKELRSALHTLLQSSDDRFLLFIDGLDEIDEKPSELADYVLRLSRLPNVKVCAASRSWPEFDDAFNGVPRLRVEQLTRADIEFYVQDRLNNSPAFGMLQRCNSGRAHNFIREVTTRACGVFLWVYIIVESLVEGLRDGDNLSQLELRLKELPTELDDLFSRILKQIPQRYAKEASELFQYVGKYPEESTILGVYLAQETLETALGTPIPNNMDIDLEYILDNMRRKIYSRCKCLLHVVAAPSKKTFPVTYLHRTVRDYLVQPEHWQWIKAQSPQYDVDVALLTSLMLESKQEIYLTKSGLMSLQPQGWEPRAMRAIHLAMNHDRITIENKIAYLDEMGKIIAAAPHVSAKQSNARDSEKRFFLNSNPYPDGFPSGYIKAPHSLFELAFSLDLGWYINAKLIKQPTLVTELIEGSYPLKAAVNAKLWSIVNVLLRHGANPNHATPKDNYSAWATLLVNTQAIFGEFTGSDHIPRSMVGPYLQALYTFLETDAFIRMAWKGPKPEQIVELVLSRLKSKDYEQDRRLLKEKFEDALKRDKVGRRITFGGIRC